MSEDEKIVILVANLGSNNKSNVNEEKRRKAISNFFEKILTEKPNFVFAQEVQDSTSKHGSQIAYVRESLGSHFGHCQVKEYGSSYNAIFWEDSQTIAEHKDVWQNESVLLDSCDEFQISSKRFRFIVLTSGRRSVLLVNYHGERNGITEEEKMQTFLVYLKLFQKFKVKRGCDYLVIGGDFNFDLDNFDRRNQMLLDQSYNLKVVPYQSERERRTKKGNILRDKVDGLICDKEMWNEDEKVVVYQRENTEGRGENTSHGSQDYNYTGVDLTQLTTIENSQISVDILDHDPVLFTLRLPKEKRFNMKMDFLVGQGILEPRSLEKQTDEAASFPFNADIFQKILQLEDDFSVMMTEIEERSVEQLENSKMTYEEELKEILLNLPEYTPGERKRLAMTTACWFTTNQFSPTILEVLFHGQVNQR
jgi:hypothetical protein